MDTPYRLHYAPDNASLVIRLVLAEIEQPFETVLVDRSRQEQRSAAYRALNPNGLIPVLETPQGPIFETAAILLWLTDTHDQLAPASDSPDRAAFLKWMFFTSNTLHADLRILFYAEKYIAVGQADALRAGIRHRLHRHLGLLEALALTAPDWFSARVSALGYYVACLMRWMALYPAQADRDWFQLTDTPSLRNMLTQLERRPAARAAIAAEGLGQTPFTSPTYAKPPEGCAT